MAKKVFWLTTIEQYGKFVSYCVSNDISVWRLYWDDREKQTRCYHIDWEAKRAFYAPWKFYVDEGFEVVSPIFVLNFGEYELIY